jgi:hypothetical protein
MKNIVPILTVIICLFLSCKETVDADFEKILGTYNGLSTYSYTGRPNGVLVQESDEGQASITVTAVNKNEGTFRISGTGLTSDAFNGYGDGIYVWDQDKLNSGTYFAVNSEINGGTARNISTRFDIAAGTVQMDYGEMIDADTSTELIHFDGAK